MFGHRFFGARYYGPRYWGDGGAAAPPPPAPPAPPAVTPAGRRRRRERYVARWRGEDHEFATLEALEQFVAEVRSAEQAKPKKLRKPVRIELSPAAIDEVERIAPPPLVRALRAEVAGAHSLEQVRQIERRIAQLRREQDDDDEILTWLM